MQRKYLARRRRHTLGALAGALAFMFAAEAPVARAQSPAAADQAGLVVRESAHSLAETERRLVDAIEQAGLKVAARIDHEANAKKVGLNLPPTVLLLFGHPKAGTALMELERTIGIDLPLKVLIWEADGKIRVAYNDPAYLARRHNIASTTSVLGGMSQLLERITAAAKAN